MTAESSTTPVDPARELAMYVARKLPQDSSPIFVTGAIVGALQGAGLLSLPEREAETARDAEQIAIAALARMGASPAWRNADARAVVRDLRAAGLLRPPTEGAAALRASGTPTAAGEES